VCHEGSAGLRTLTHHACFPHHLVDDGIRKSPDDRDTRSGMRVADVLLNITTPGSQGWEPQGGEP
jgi:hypothetical protein